MNTSIYSYNYLQDKFERINHYDFSELSKREVELIEGTTRFNSVNTYILKDDHLFIKFSYIRAILKKSSVIFFFPNKIYIKELNKNYIQQYNKNFICSMLEIIIEYIHQEASAILLKYNLNIDDLTEIHKLQIDVKDQKSQYEDLVNLLGYLLDNDDDLEEISEIMVNGKRDLEDDRSGKSGVVGEVESVLENGRDMLRDVIKEYKRIDNILENKKNNMEIELAQMRNKIALFSLKINFLAMLFSFGSFCVGIFGMNLNNGFEDSPFGLYIYTSPLIIIMAGLYIHKYQNNTLHQLTYFDIKN